MEKQVVLLVNIKKKELKNIEEKSKEEKEIIKIK